MVTRTHRYRIVTGPHAGRVVEGFQIGYTAYPDQVAIEKLSHVQVMDLYQTNKEGFWIPGDNVKIDFENRIDSRSITTVVNYGNVEDLVITFDKYNQEIFVGDELYAASKNAVRRVKVTKIADKPVWTSNGIQRKLTVKDVDDGQTLVINESRDTVKVVQNTEKTS